MTLISFIHGLGSKYIGRSLRGGDVKAQRDITLRYYGDRR